MMPVREEPTRPSRARDWEALCDPSNGCGTTCCYYEGSPCEHLRIVDHQQRRGVCRIYATRFGEHRTVDGKAFQCVPMSAWLLRHPAPAHCGYAEIASINGTPVIRGQR